MADLSPVDVDFFLSLADVVGAMAPILDWPHPMSTLVCAFAVHQVARFLQNPGLDHWKAVKRILRYLSGTQDQGITLGGPSQALRGYFDSDWAGCPDTRRSTTGYVFFLNGCPISWKCQRQATPARSSTEAEYMSLSHATAEALWLRSLLRSLALPLTSTPLYG